MRDCYECGGSELTMNRDFLSEDLSLYRLHCTQCGHGGPGAFDEKMARRAWDWHVEEEQERKQPQLDKVGS